MAFIEETTGTGKIVRKYRIPMVKTKESALLWIYNAADNDQIVTTDLRAVFNKPVEDRGFVESEKNLRSAGLLTLAGLFHDLLLTLDIDLESFEISVSGAAEYWTKAAWADLETALGLA